MRVVAKRIFEKKLRICEGHVGYVFSGRQCRKRATWKVNKEHLCGTHANVAVMRIIEKEFA